MTRSDLPITYPIPLRGDAVFGMLTLPADLTAAEAERVCRIVRSLVMGTEEVPDAE